MGDSRRPRWTGSLAAPGRLVGKEMETGMARRAASPVHVGRCRCDRPSRSEDRPDEGVIDLSPAAMACGGLAL